MEIVIFIATIPITFILVYFIRHLAIKKSIVDIPNERSSHSIPTPRGGGLAIAIVWYFGISIFNFFDLIPSQLYWALMSGILLSIISFIDDVVDLSPRIRLFAQVASSGLALWFLGGLKFLDIGLFHIDQTFLLSAMMFGLMIWFINLFNFLDGIDGYLGSEAIFVIGGLWYFTGANWLLLMVAAVIGFLLWNWPWPKAKIFCGDVGSTLIGFTIAVLMIYFQNIEVVNIWLVLILTALFVVDASLTLMRRAANGENISEAHRKHAYQRIVQSGFSHKKTLIYSYAINLVLFLIAYVAFENEEYSLPLLGAAYLVVFVVSSLVDKRFPFPRG